MTDSDSQNEGGTRWDKVGQNPLVPRGTGTGIYIDTCPTLGHGTCPASGVVPPSAGHLRGKIKAAVLELCTERDCVSFVEICNRLAEKNLPFRGDQAAVLTDHPDIILWPNLSADVLAAIASLLQTGKLHLWPSCALVYFVDGRVPGLPIAKRIHDYKQPRWLPVTFRRRPYRGQGRTKLPAVSGQGPEEDREPESTPETGPENNTSCNTVANPGGGNGHIFAEIQPAEVPGHPDSLSSDGGFEGETQTAGQGVNQTGAEPGGIRRTKIFSWPATA
jgi:hypothetical protein